MTAETEAVLARVLSGLVHEISNPANVITINIHALQRLFAGLQDALDALHAAGGEVSVAGLPYAQARTDMACLLEGIGAGARRLGEVLHELRALPQPGVSCALDVNDVIRGAVNSMNGLIARSTQAFDVQYGATLPLVAGDAAALEYVICALIKNACEALISTSDGIRVASRPADGGGAVVVTVQDAGTGLAAAELARIGEPFFTTKRQRGCRGLSMYKSRRILAAHHATLAFTPAAGGGIVATVRLPGLAAAPRRAPRGVRES